MTKNREIADIIFRAGPTTIPPCIGAVYDAQSVLSKAKQYASVVEPLKAKSAHVRTSRSSGIYVNIYIRFYRVFNFFSERLKLKLIFFIAVSYIHASALRKYDAGHAIIATINTVCTYI